MLFCYYTDGTEGTVGGSHIQKDTVYHLGCDI